MVFGATLVDFPSNNGPFQSIFMPYAEFFISRFSSTTRKATSCLAELELSGEYTCLKEVRGSWLSAHHGEQHDHAAVSGSGAADCGDIKDLTATSSSEGERLEELQRRSDTRLYNTLLQKSESFITKGVCKVFHLNSPKWSSAAAFLLKISAR